MGYVKNRDIFINVCSVFIKHKYKIYLVNNYKKGHLPQDIKFICIKFIQNLYIKLVNKTQI